MTQRLRILVLITILALVAAACSGDTGDDAAAAEFETVSEGLRGEGDDSAPADVADLDVPAAEEAASDEPDSITTQASDDDLGDGGVVPVNPIDLGRDIVYTAWVSVEVTDVAAASRQATQVMQSFGALLFGQQTQGGTEPSTTLVFRVLPNDFQEALDELGSIGTVRNQQVSADDVTERVVDLQSRINTAAASVERLQVLLEGATNINDVAELENQLLQRETNLETLRGQLRTVQDQVDLATITLTITEAILRPGISIEVSSYPGEGDKGLSCPGATALSVEEGTVTTVCFEIRNIGDRPLTDITLTDPVLEVDLDDLEAVFIQPSDILEPGQSAVYFLELTADQTLRLQTRVGAIPLDDDGAPLPGRGVADTATATIQAFDPGGVPTFSDGLKSSWEGLIWVTQVFLLALGSIIPFLWIAVLIWLYLRWRSRRNEPTVSEPSPKPVTAEEPESEPADA